MATTTNFGWETPDDTDLVKDGALAMRTLGNSIDTSFVDLKGGTTGQVLSKASNTDLDFSWVAVDPLTILDAKGDLITATAADTPARLAVGTNGQVLTADSTTSTGLKWATASGGGKVLQVVSTTYSTQTTNTSTGTYADSGLSLSITPTLSTSKVLVIISQAIACDGNPTTDVNADVRVLRGATQIWQASRAVGIVGASSNMFANAHISIVYLDSPATTSSTTYKTQHKPNACTRTNAQWASEGTSSITLLEIGA